MTSWLFSNSTIYCLALIRLAEQRSVEKSYKSNVTFWVNWCKNECFWRITTCMSFQLCLFFEWWNISLFVFDNAVVSQSTIDAYDIATRLEVPESNEEIPLYQKINEELDVKYKGQQKVYESQLNENIPLRIDSHMPVSFW